MNNPESLPSLASVVFIRIADYNRRSVAEQARLRSQLESAVAVALQAMPAHQRITLDAADGMAIAVLRNPETALDIARRCKCLAEIGITLSVGINHGPIQLTPDDTDHPGLIGDAISVAASIAQFGGTRDVTMSRAFADALADANPQRARELKRAGIFTDAQVRTHELFVCDSNGAATRRKVVFALGGVIVAGLLGGALIIREQQHNSLMSSRRAGFTQRLRELVSGGK